MAYPHTWVNGSGQAISAAALEEIEAEIDTKATAAAVTAHVTDTTAAHAASAISFTPTGTIASTDVQAAIAEVAAEAGGGGGGSAVYGPPCGWVGAEAFQAFVAMPTNRCYLYRCRGGGTITGITLWIATSSGNISVGVVGSAGGVAPPVTRRATSGAVPCPAAGYVVVTIPSTVVDPSDYFALSQDDGVATFAAGPAGVISEHFANPFVGSGQMVFAGGSHPIPATVAIAGTLVSGGHILSGA